jgi:nitrate/nitrite-specific signal transduction histidine kinase
VTYLKPKLHRLTKEVRHVARGNYDALIEVRGEDEIAVLSTEFNNMVEAIKQRDEKINSQLKTFTTLFDISSILKRAESLQEDITLILNALEVGLNIQQCSILFIDDIGKVEL